MPSTSAGAGGINSFGAVALDQAQDADAGAEALLGMGPRAQDDIEHGGVRADRLGLMADALVGPVAIAPVWALGMCSGTVVGRCGRRLRRWLATRFQAGRHPQFHFRGLLRLSGRDGHYWSPPAQIRTRPIKASGSYSY